MTLLLLVAIMGLSGCTDSSDRTGQDKLNEQQRTEEPQQRDGIPDPAITDSLANDTAD